MTSPFARYVAGLLACALVVVTPARAELVEEIVAWVNGDIITLTDLDDEQQTSIADAYRRFAGEELDRQVQRIRDELLLNLIDRKILLHRAAMLYDVDKMGEVFLDGFRRQQEIESDDELNRILEQEGMTFDELKEKLVELFAPDEVLRFEVSGRISVGDKEVEAYYAENQEEFLVAGEASICEIVLLADTAEKREARREELAAIQKRIADGESFEELATELSEAGTRESGGMMKGLTRGDLSEQLEEFVFTLPVGAVSEPLETAYGFHIIKIEARREDVVAPLEEIREQVRATLEEKTYARDFQAFITKARSEAEWCVKRKYRARLTVDSPECDAL